MQRSRASEFLMVDLRLCARPVDARRWLAIHFMSFSRITKRDNPVTLAKRVKEYEELLLKALSIAKQHVKRQPRDVKQMLASARVQGMVPNYKVASIEYPNAKYNSTWYSNMSWNDLKDATAEEIAENIIPTIRHNLYASKKGLYKFNNEQMRFEGRQLKPHPTYVNHKLLKEGRVYFVVSFIDNDLLVPELQSIVFIGRNLLPDDRSKIYFQDFSSYQEGARFPASRGTAANFICFSANEHYVQDFEEAINELLRCSIKRKTGPG
jgi:hypothetical protein